MRLWHQKLIPQLPRQQLLGQHRECCALRGKGWGRNHSTVNYVFQHNPALLVAYHYLIMEEMKNRGYQPNEIWYDSTYRGSTLGHDKTWDYGSALTDYLMAVEVGATLYPEHNDTYYQECIENLKGKGIELE